MPLSTRGGKENILLEQYTGVNEFQFVVQAQGLIPDVADGPVIQLLDEATGDAVLQFNRAWAMDSYIAEDTAQEDTVSEEMGTPLLHRTPQQTGLNPLMSPP